MPPAETGMESEEGGKHLPSARSQASAEGAAALSDASRFPPKQPNKQIRSSREETGRRLHPVCLLFAGGRLGTVARQHGGLDVSTQLMSVLIRPK